MRFALGMFFGINALMCFSTGLILWGVISAIIAVGAFERHKELLILVVVEIMKGQKDELFEVW